MKRFLSVVLVVSFAGMVNAETHTYQPAGCNLSESGEPKLLRFLRTPSQNGGKPEPIGVITEAVEGAWVNRIDPATGEVVPIKAKAGMRVYETDTLRTPRGPNAFITVDTLDHGVMRMADNADVYIQNYIIDSEKEQVRQAEISVAKGWLRFAGDHALGPEENFEIHTPTMTIGIRGTAGIVNASSSLNTDLFLTDGKVDVCRKEKRTGETLDTAVLEADDNGEFLRASRKDIRISDVPPKNYLEKLVPTALIKPTKSNLDAAVALKEPKAEVLQYADTSLRNYRDRPWMRYRDIQAVKPGASKFYTGSMAIKHGFKQLGE